MGSSEGDRVSEAYTHDGRHQGRHVAARGAGEIRYLWWQLSHGQLRHHRRGQAWNPLWGPTSPNKRGNNSINNNPQRGKPEPMTPPLHTQHSTLQPTAPTAHNITARQATATGCRCSTNQLAAGACGALPAQQRAWALPTARLRQQER
jgi:hypothetical protein